MAGDFRLVTEWFLAYNFGQSLINGLSFDYDNVISKDCSQILNRYNVQISDSVNPSLRCPSQNEISDIVVPTDLFFPEAFSPNNDGIHDDFKIQNLWAYPVNHMRIYDQNGMTVFESDSYHLNWWNGQFNNNGGLVPMETYYYVCTINHKVVKKSYVYVSYRLLNN